MTTTVSTTTTPPPIMLIDVDCNLWHRDLKTLRGGDTVVALGTDDDTATTTSTNGTDVWNILKEDAIEKANIVAMVSPSSTIQEAMVGLIHLNTYPPPPILVKTTVGVHPYHVNDDEFIGKTLEEHKDTIKDLLTGPHTCRHCVAVGECGLDATEGFPPIQDQLPWFQMQREVAEELKLPLFVHERLAFDRTMTVLDGIQVPVIIHCFTGTKEECIAYIERGYYISISGYILKETNDNCAKVVSCLEEGIVPLNKLMIETDAPYMGFTDCRRLYLQNNDEFLSTLNSKKRKRFQQSTYPNVPSSLPMVLSKVTECLQRHDPTLTIEKVAEVTTANARSFFRL